MTKLLARLAAVAAVALSATAAHAASVSANLGVSASVNANCTVTTSAVAFGAYDPVVANATATSDLDAAGAVTVACTKGTPYTVTLGNGQNALTDVDTGVVTRRMSSGGDFLAYELYTSSARDVVWNATTVPTTGPAASKAPVAIQVYGRIEGGQDVAAGAYGDTVSATVNY